MLLDVYAPSDFVLLFYFDSVVFVHTGSERSQTESRFRDHVEACELHNWWKIQTQEVKKTKTKQDRLCWSATLCLNKV